MKKLVALIIAGIMSLTMVACGNSSSSDEPTSVESSDEPTSVENSDESTSIENSDESTSVESIAEEVTSAIDIEDNSAE